MVTDISPKSGPAIAQTIESEELSISVVIVNYNSRELLRACLASIELEQPGEVTVIDNASADGSDEMVKQDFPWARMIRSAKNDGYGAAANLAIANCSSKYVLLLNCDTFLQPGALRALRNYLDQSPQVAIVGPLLVNPDGTTQPSCFPFPTPLQVLRKETSLSRFWKGEFSNGSPHCARSVQWVLGAALAIRRQAFESVGGFDPSFFMYFEEVDLCYRLGRSGWQTHFTPEATVTHIGGASTSHQRSAMLVQFYKSLCHFYQLHYSSMQIFQLKLVLTYLMLRHIIQENLKQAPKTLSEKSQQSKDEPPVWRLILSNVWSTKAWLKR